MTTTEYTPIYLGIFLLLGIIIVNIIFALIVQCFFFVLVLSFSFLFLALLLLHLVLVFFFDKVNLAIYFLLLFLGSYFCFIDGRSTKATVFQVAWADIEIVLRIC